MLLGGCLTLSALQLDDDSAANICPKKGAKMKKQDREIDVGEDVKSDCHQCIQVPQTAFALLSFLSLAHEGSRRTLHSQITIQPSLCI